MGTRDAKLHEQSSTIKLPEGKGDKYRIRVISAGQGSSAFYPAEMLKRDGAKAFPAGTRMKANHDSWMDMGGNVDRLRAKTISAAQWDEADQALYADIQVAEAWSEWVREFGDCIGVSISASGKLVEEEVDGEIRYTCEQLFSAENSPYNSIDFVEAPGANGRIVQALESAKNIAESLNIKETSALEKELLEKKSEATPPRINEEDEVPMDKKELEEILSERDNALLGKLTEALKPAAPAESDKPSLKTISEAIVKAELTEHGREAVYEAIERGEGLDKAVEREIAREKAIAEKYATKGAAQGGVFVDEGKAKDGAKAFDEAEWEALVGKVAE